MAARSDDTPETIGRLTRDRVATALDAMVFAPGPQFLQRIELFAANLARWGSRTNLTAAPRDPDELAFHIIDSLMAIPLAARHAHLQGLFADRQRVLDLGSGAGFPGLILAAASEARFVLLENRRKRAHFLEVAAASMGLANVQIATSQVSLEGSGPFDLVVGRAFAKPADFYRGATVMLGQSARALLYATPTQPLDDAAAAEVGLRAAERLPYAVRRGERRVDRQLVLWCKV